MATATQEKRIIKNAQRTMVRLRAEGRSYDEIGVLAAQQMTDDLLAAEAPRKPARRKAKMKVTPTKR